jgi:ribosome maturation factor RimP
VAENVRRIVEPFARELGLSIWDVRYLKEGSSYYVRIFIDKEGGVTLDDCVDLSHAVDKPLDDADPVPQSYCLEVSSPGLERELMRDEHFTACLGQKVKLRLIRPREGKREFRGTLEAYSEGIITVRTGDGNTLDVDKKETGYVKLDDFEDSEVIEK